jgi:hypothetical protein
MNEQRTGKGLRQMEHIRRNLCGRKTSVVACIFAVTYSFPLYNTKRVIRRVNRRTDNNGDQMINNNLRTVHGKRTFDQQEPLS